MGKDKKHCSHARRRSLSPKRRKEQDKELAMDDEESECRNETAEEKYARRLARKKAKEKKRRQKMGWNDDYMGYTNDDNPFGDANLLKPFVWHKKREREGVRNLTEKEHTERDRARMMENRRELEKVKKRRQEREEERVAREQELEMIQRMKEAEQFKEWGQEEDEFHLEQAKLRSKIRLRDGRAKPIDLLAKYVTAEEDEMDMDIEMNEPYTILNGLSGTDLEDLLEDIKVYMDLEQGRHLDYWKDITVVCESELHKLRKAESSMRTGSDSYDRRGGIHKAVGQDVYKVFHGKTYFQLQELKKQVTRKIHSGDAVDVGYWESLLQELKGYMAKARLRERHQGLLKHKLEHLKTQIQGDNDNVDAVRSAERGCDSPKLIPHEQLEAQVEEDNDDDDDDDHHDDHDDDDDDAVSSANAAERVCYSPKLIPYEDLDENRIMLTNAEEDHYQLEIARQHYLGKEIDTTAAESDQKCLEEAQRGLVDEDESTFNVQVPIGQKMYLWQDKYRPRKPRFFNRVHTGFEWNKYNQTHYDADNPPPKIVQGYKFNIFYPDLINKKDTPQFFLDGYPGSEDFLILRFHAGPPYEDIAFKVVNREWDYSHQHGFRCQYSQGIFQLWYRFKRYRYRR
ncbi:splicing factor Cactin-like [Corticium candelabrum]|uniref:splicing factor Cactin-like n=1 Tax=Corticium candelabrum TaxID=121492 RepID=UPI002E263170|nr:splicing factor Cactin-like [Corticium candelabrum]